MCKIYLYIVGELYLSQSNSTLQQKQKKLRYLWMCKIYLYIMGELYLSQSNSILQQKHKNIKIFIDLQNISIYRR